MITGFRGSRMAWLDRAFTPGMFPLFIRTMPILMHSCGTIRLVIRLYGYTSDESTTSTDNTVGIATANNPKTVEWRED